MKVNWKNENRKYENNVVYQITMGEYAYIGQTSRPLIMRVREHLYSETSEVHNFIENNDIEEINVKILYHLPSNKKLDKKETKAIAQYIRYNSKKKGFKNLINKDFKGIDKKSIEELKDLIKKS